MRLKAIKRLVYLILVALLYNCSRSTQGEQIYTLHCNSCHMENGNGLAALIPPLQPEKFSADRELIICKVIQGINDSASGHFMPSYRKLSNADLANVLNYIRSIKAKNSPLFTDKEVERSREGCR